MKTAIRDLSWLASLCDPDADYPSEVGKKICATPYTLDLNGKNWSMGTNGIVAALVCDEIGLPRLDGAAADKFRKFLQSGLKLKATIATTTAELLAWASMCNCPTCGTRSLAIEKLPSLSDDRRKIAPAWLGKTAIDKRQLMRVLPHVLDRYVAIGSTKEWVAIQGDGLIVCLAGIHDERYQPGEIADRFTPRGNK